MRSTERDRDSLFRWYGICVILDTRVSYIYIYIMCACVEHVVCVCARAVYASTTWVVFLIFNRGPATRHVYQSGIPNRPRHVGCAVVSVHVGAAQPKGTQLNLSSVRL